jgi:selenocysteine-specific elongation factor
LGTRALERGVIIGTAGHIDHGKTALVRVLTGVDTDRLPEEKRRGITIDLGFAPLLLDDVGTVGIVDVPGHEDFVRSMLVGASGIDLGLLVIAADEGVMPQTREHLLILQLLRIPRIVVALTKADLVDSEWEALVRTDIVSLFRDAEMEVPSMVACSSRTGVGIAELRNVLSATLASAAPRAVDDLFRLPVDRAFSIRGTGTVVTGTVWSGELTEDAIVRVIPGDKTARVRRLEQHGAIVKHARAGARAAVALAGLDVADVPRGSVLVTDPNWRATTLFEAAIAVAPDAVGIISPRTQLRIHAGASEANATVAFASTSAVGPLMARVQTDLSVVLRGGDRFVLRLPAPLRTIGGGTVLDPYAKRRALAQLSASELNELTAHPSERLRFILRSDPLRGVPSLDVAVRVGSSPAALSSFANADDIRAGARNLFASEDVQLVMSRVERIVAEFEVHSPLSPGVPARTLRESLRCDDELADITIREMERRGQIELVGPVVRRPGWKPSPTPADLNVSNHVAHDICAAGREPPSVSELVARYGSSVPAVLHFLEREGRLVQVETDRYYDRSAVEELVAKLKAELLPGRSYVPAQLRDILGFSRKYLIPFLEFCDRNRVTERRGEGRVLRQTSDILLDASLAHP